MWIKLYNMRRHPKFIQTTTNEYIEIEGFFDRKFRLANKPGLFYDIERGVFYTLSQGIQKTADLQAKYPDMFKDWLRQEDRRMEMLKKQNIIKP